MHFNATFQTTLLVPQEGISVGYKRSCYYIWSLATLGRPRNDL